MKKYLIISDKEELLNRFDQLLRKKRLTDLFDYGYSYNNNDFVTDYHKSFHTWLYKPEPINIKDKRLFGYELIISLHCKQLFPKELIEKVRCINVHPGFNPYNRGWYPQVFSILNDLPFGVTIHEIDDKIDHGPIIVQEKINIESHDTSLSSYEKVVEVEMKLLDKHLEDIINKNYTFTILPDEGNINYKKDFENLGEMKLDDIDTLENHIKKIRALTHGNYKNAYFIDKNGNKIYIKIELTK